MKVNSTISYLILLIYLMNAVNSMNCKVNRVTFLNCKSCLSNGCKDCLDGYYLTSSHTCTACPFSPCTACYNENMCTKCAKGFIRLRYDFNNIKCVMIDDRMNIENCSMYISENNNVKCIDCIAGYKMNFEENICVKRDKDDKSIDVDAIL